MRFRFSSHIFVLFPIILAFSATPAKGQTLYHLFHKKKKKKELRLPAPEAPDRKYIADYHKEFTARIFGSRKYATYGLHDKGFPENIQYRPNSPFNIGVGFNYRIIGINAGFNLPFINDTKEQGKTQALDLQTHVYGRKLVFDVYLQRYKGFYLPNTNLLTDNNNNQLYIRPDLLTVNLGVSAQYLFNGKRFSFRGAFLQNELQLKSAGSMILGAALSNVNIHSDSSIIPHNLKYTDYFNDIHFRRSNISSVNANFGYGYTFVLPYDLFLTAAGSGGLGINYTTMRIKGGTTLSDLGADFSATVRISLGYNSRRYYAGIHYIGTVSSSSTPITYARQEFGAGNFRVSFARRFTLKKRLLGFY